MSKPDFSVWAFASFGGFGFGIWRTEMHPGVDVIWTFAIGPFTWHLRRKWDTPSNV